MFLFIDDVRTKILLAAWLKLGFAGGQGKFQLDLFALKEDL